MKKVLFLPLLQLSSGHHQAAESVAATLTSISHGTVCKKIDLLNYTSSILEKMISTLYLQTIKISPSLYSWLYQNQACQRLNSEKRVFFYELLFLKGLQKIIFMENPDIIVCTHALPSNLVNSLKKNKIVNKTVINVYTDYFVNNLWGLQHIDYHFAPTTAVKEFLLDLNVPEQKIFVTGIPVHPSFSLGKNVLEEQLATYSVLVSGGSLGVGSLKSIFAEKKSNRIHYFVLCGKNQKLYQEIGNWRDPLITPISYLANRNEMNAVYEQMDLVLTKPGGMTISECLYKQLPIYLLPPLPGQEEQNFSYLINEGLVINKSPNFSLVGLEERLLQFLENPAIREKHTDKLKQHIKNYVPINWVLKELLL